MNLLIALGTFGNVIAIVLYTSPMPTFWRIYKNKSTEEFSGLPYVCTLLNCLLWCLYGLPLVKPDGLFIITINSAGCAFQMSYLFLFVVYSAKQERVKVLWMLLTTTILYPLMCLLTAFVIPYSRRELVVGLFCTVFNISMYAAPLSVMRMVIRTRSVEFMPFFLSLLLFISGIIWTAYAVAASDIYLTVPNALGTISGALQLCLYVWYRKATPLPIKDERNSLSAASRQAKKHPSSSKVVSIPQSPVSETPVRADDENV